MKHRSAILTFVAAVAVAVMTTAAFAARVVRIVDGDTIVVLLNGRPAKIRLLGVDTPEHHQSRKLLRDAQCAGVSVRTMRQWGKLATRFTGRSCFRKDVRLIVGGSRRGRYGRLLAYVILPDGRNLNAEIIRAGFGLAYRRYRHRLRRQFIRIEREARLGRKGLWPSVPI